ncbi:carbonic anhydrase [Olivibacter sitiensis]|uniref:carbonic anhydrase n=1 Tax=Olivibacter sitiensis TaxID=376470 RepID=UPI000412CF71|nr:carbonic anhydrase [Olivibacter sitiensis]
MGKEEMNTELRTSYDKLFVNNSQWVDKIVHEDPNFFVNLAKGQTPEVLWIGCSDSRVPANEVTGTKPGDIFVHRNIANMCVHSDMNMLSVLDYAVNVLKVKHVIVAGHYGCGGVAAALTGKQYGLIDNWLRHIKDVYRLHKGEIDGIGDQVAKDKRMVELNAIEQAANLSKTTIIQNAWKQRDDLAIHAIVIDLESGYLKDLGVTTTSTSKLDDVFDLTTSV